jgi:hypothetical protein
LKVATMTCHPPTISFKASLKVVVVMRHGTETMQRPAGWMVDERRLPQSPGVKDELNFFIIRCTLISFYLFSSVHTN